MRLAPLKSRAGAGRWIPHITECHPRIQEYLAILRRSALDEIDDHLKDAQSMNEILLLKLAEGWYASLRAHGENDGHYIATTLCYDSAADALAQLRAILKRGQGYDASIESGLIK